MLNKMSAGKMPKEAASCFCGANLFATIKKRGGIRPVAVGEVLRRLCSKCLATKVAPAAAAYLTPLQFGVGVKGGCEAVVHATREVLADITLPPQQRGHLVVDLDNSFNTRDRPILLEEVKVHFPQLYPW